MSPGPICCTGWCSRSPTWPPTPEGLPRRTVPRLDNDLALPDQLRVVTADLLAADPPAEALAGATAEVNAARQAL